jgi:hypothetical protein
MAGVVKNRGTVERGPENTIISVVPLRDFAVAYFDGQGIRHDTVWAAGGGQVFELPNAEAIARDSKPIKDLFVQQFNAQLALKGDAPPPKDSVEVV